MERFEVSDHVTYCFGGVTYIAGLLLAGTILRRTCICQLRTRSSLTNRYCSAVEIGSST